MELNPPVATRIPYEIISEIIAYAYKYILGATEPDGVELDLQLVSPPIAASHVCRSWRYGLLSDPSMWACIVIPKIRPSGVLELLRRSGSALLSVSLNMRDHFEVYLETPDVLASLFSQIHRIKLLHVEASYALPANSRYRRQRLIAQVLSYLRQPAPELQTFRCWYSSLDVSLQETFLDTLFSGVAPNLKRLHHVLSHDFRELKCPLFRDLSELYLTLPYFFTFNFDRFLDLLELSPRLGLFRLYVAWDWHVRLSPDFISDRKINLPYMQRLVLEVNTALELLPLIFEHIVLPSDFKWHIDLQYQLEFTTNLFPLSRLIFKSHFTSLHMTFNDADFVYLSFEENRVRQCINQFNANKLMYTHDNTADLMYLWDPLIQSVDASSITRFSIEVEATLKYAKLPEILASLGKLVFLSIKQESSADFDFDDEVEPCVSCLSALTPSIELSEALEHDTNGSKRMLSNSIAPEVLCPRLRELNVELSRSRFNETHASLVRTCYDLRRKAGYPLKISVRCLEMEKGVESILHLGECSAIDVSVVRP